ncbi:MAG: hypothetical protein ACLT8D_11480, partial [Oscillospiraceae bacterium]
FLSGVQSEHLLLKAVSLKLRLPFLFPPRFLIIPPFVSPYVKTQAKQATFTQSTNVRIFHTKTVYHINPYKVNPFFIFFYFI